MAANFKQRFPEVRLEILRFLLRNHDRIKEMDRRVVFTELAEHLRSNVGSQYSSFRRDVMSRFEPPFPHPEAKKEGIRVHDLHSLEAAFHHLAQEKLVPPGSTNKAHLLDNRALETARKEVMAVN